MGAVLDFTKFTFSAEQIRAVNELVFDEILEAPEIELLCTVFPGIVSDKEMGFIGEGGLVGVANSGCDPVPQDWSIDTRKLTWTPTDWEILIAECWKDLKSTAAVYSLKTKVDIADFTSTDYMNIVVDVLTKAMKKFIMRLFWFNDTDAENVVDGGIITDGVAIKYFTILDGFWKQLLTQVTANPAQRVTIAENAGVSYATQALVIANITPTLQSLIYKAPLLLRNDPAAFIACTQSIYDAYAQAQQQNAQQDAVAQQFNLGVDQTNLQQSNAELDINDRNSAAYRNEKSKYISAIGSDIGEVGKEEIYKKIAKTTTGYSWLGEYQKMNPNATPKEIEEAAKKAGVLTDSTTKKDLGGYLLKNKGK